VSADPSCAVDIHEYVQVDILRFTPFRLRLRLPEPNLAGDALRAVLRQHISDGEIVGVTTLPVDPLCAILHLRSAEAMSQLILSRRLPTTTATGGASPKVTGPAGSGGAKPGAKRQTALKKGEESRVEVLSPGSAKAPASPAKPSAGKKMLSGAKKGKEGSVEVLSPGSAKAPASPAKPTGQVRTFIAAHGRSLARAHE
jgi:hypothetical protein